MITRAESIVHLCGAAAISAALLGVGLGAIGPRGRARVRGLWLAAGALASVMTLFVANVELNFDPGGGELIFAAAAVLIGLAIAAPLVARGLRGQYVGDHPHCRRCGFDLTGRPETSDACSECGARLAEPGAITTGVRQRRPVPLAIGAFAMVLSLAVGSVVARQAMARPGAMSLTQMTPTSWLIGDVEKGVAGEPLVAAAELARRLSAGDLDAAQAEAFVAAVTKRAAAMPTLGPTAGMAVLDAWTRGLISESTMRGVVRSLATPTLLLAPQSSPTRLPFALAMPGLDSLRARTGMSFTVALADRADTIDGEPVAAERIAGAAAAYDGRFPWTWHTGGVAGMPFGRLYQFDDAPLPAGPRAVRVRATATVTVGTPGAGPIVETVAVDVSGTTTIVPGLARPLPSAGPADPTVRATLRVAGRRDGVQLLALSLRLPVAFVGDLVAREASGDRVLGAVWCERSYALVETAERMSDAPLFLVPRPERGLELLVAPLTYQHEIPVDAPELQPGREWRGRGKGIR